MGVVVALCLPFCVYFVFCVFISFLVFLLFLVCLFFCLFGWGCLGFVFVLFCFVLFFCLFVVVFVCFFLGGGVLDMSEIKHGYGKVILPSHRAEKHTYK